VSIFNFTEAKSIIRNIKISYPGLASPGRVPGLSPLNGILGPTPDIHNIIDRTVRFRQSRSEKIEPEPLLFGSGLSAWKGIK
jgi:hypothetical protein